MTATRPALAEALAEGVDPADLGVAWVVAAQARRVGDRDLDLGADRVGRLAQRDRVPFDFDIFARAVEPLQPRHLREQRLRLREDVGPDAAVELARELARELEVLHLVLPTGTRSAL